MLVLWAGADHPPPPRFLSVVLPVVLVGALLVSWRAAGYARWRSQRRTWRVGRVIGEGALAGLALGGILAALPGPREPGVPISWAAVSLWLAVMVAVGIVNALLVYLLAGGSSRDTGGPTGPSGAASANSAADDPADARSPGSLRRPEYPHRSTDREA